MNSTSDRVLWTGASEKLGIDFHQNIINSVELVEQEDINKSSTVTVLNNDDNLLPDIVSSIDFSKPRTADEFLQLFSSLASDKSDGNEVPEVSSSTPSEVINIKSNQDSHMKPTLNTSSTLQQTVSKILQSSELNIPNSLPPPRYINTDITYTGSAFGLSTSKESTTSSSSSSSSALKIEESLPCSPLCAWYLNDGMPNFSKYSSSSVSLKQMQSMERNQLLRNISSLKTSVDSTLGKRSVTYEETSTDKRMKAFIQSPSTVSETTVDKTTETVNNKDDKSISMLDNDNNNAAKILVEAAGEELKRYKYLEKLICDSV